MSEYCLVTEILNQCRAYLAGSLDLAVERHLIDHQKAEEIFKSIECLECKQAHDETSKEAFLNMMTRSQKPNQLDTRQPMVFFWWLPKSITDAENLKKELESKGALVLSTEKVNGTYYEKNDHYSMVFAVNKSKIERTLSYRSGEDEHLSLSPYRVIVSYCAQGKIYAQERYELAVANEKQITPIIHHDVALHSKHVNPEINYKLYLDITPLADKDLYECVCTLID